MCKAAALKIFGLRTPSHLKVIENPKEHLFMWVTSMTTYHVKNSSRHLKNTYWLIK